MKKVLKISGTLVLVLCLLGTYSFGQKVSKATGPVSALTTWTDLIPGTGNISVSSGNIGGTNATPGSISINDALFDNQNNFIGIVVSLPTTTSFTLQNGALISISVAAFRKQGTSDAALAPVSDDYLVIRNGHTITIDQAFTSRNTIVNNGIITTTSPLTFNSGAAYIHYRNGGVIPTAIWDASSNCFIIGMTANSPAGSDQNFGNFAWNCPSQTANGDIAGPNEMVVNGNFNLVSTGTGLTTLRNAVTIKGNLIISAGTIDVSAANYQITIGGNWVNGNGGDGFTERKGTVIFKGSANQRISKPIGMVGEVFYNLVINNPSGIRLDDNNITAINTISMLDGNIDANGRTLVLNNPSTGALVQTNGQLYGGFFRRAVNAISGSYLFPVGTNNYYNSLLIGFNSVAPSGYLDVQFLEGDPLGGGLPLSEGGVNINNQYTDGYWSVTSSAGYTSTYDLTLNAEGFTSYTIDESTRILKRTDFGNWALSGIHTLQVPPLCKRTAVSGIDATGSTTYFGLGKSDCITISSEPSDVNSCIGQNAGFSVSATGSGLTFRWQKNGVDLSDTGPYSNTGTEAMTITNVSDAEVGLYRCRITSTCSGSTVVFTKNALLDLSLPFPSLGYKYYRNITIDQSMVQGLSDLTNFPLLISGTYPFLRTIANGGQVQNANGYDIAFTDNRGFKLDHQIEKYDPATGEFIAWVRMPVLYTYQNTGLRMLYGNPQVTGNPSVNTVFNSDFRGVWHLNDQNIITDQTGGGSNGTNMGTGGAVNIAGKIGGALDFVNGDGDFISIANEPRFDLQNAITVSAWIKVKSFTVAGQAIITKGNSAWSLQRNGTNNSIGFYLDPSAILNGTVNVNDGNWHYVVGTFDRQLQSLYIDGVLDNFTGNTNQISLNNYDVYIGNNSESTGRFFDGIIDEARVSAIARSGSWVKTEYANQSNPGSFYTIGPESPNSIFGNFAACGSTSTIYSVPNSPGHIYTWSVTGGTFLPTSGNSIYVTWNETGPWNIQLAESSGGCSASSQNFNVTVNPLPVPVITGDNDVCPGAAGEVYSTPLVPGNTYNWTFTGGTVSGSYIENSISVDWDATGPGTLKVTEYNTTTGCSVTTPDYVVQIRDLIVPVIIAPSPVTVFTDAGNCTASGVALGNPVTSDNCTIASVINDAPALFPLGTTTVTWTVTDGVGNTATATQTVTVNVLPAPVLTSSDTDNTFCPGTSVTFTATGIGWTNFDFRINGVSVQNGLLQTYTTNALTNGQIVDVKVTNAGGCSATSSGITNTVYPLPVVTFPGVLASQCVSSVTYLLSGGTPAGGTYSGPGVTGTNFNASAAGVGTHTITYRYTNGNGCTNTATNTIIVNALPVVTFPGVLVPQCVSSTVYTLSGGTPAGGTYSGPGVTGTNFNASVAGAGTHTITYTYTDIISGCTNTATNTIVVNPLPSVTFSGVLTAQCISSTVYVLGGGTPAGGTYSGPGVTGNNFNASVAGIGTHTIIYSYTSITTGCTNTATNTIVVNALPVVTFTGVLTSQCFSSTTYLLSGGSPSGGTYSGPGVSGTNFNAFAAGVGTHTITYRYTNPAGCTNTATNTIIVKALPLVAFSGVLPSLCASSTVYTLSGGTPAGGTYSGPGVTGTNFNASAAGAGTHSIVYSYTDIVTGCSNSATRTIVVKALPVVTFTGILTAQCINSTVYVLSGGTPAGGNYSGPGVTGTNFNASVAGAGTHTITYSYTDISSGCSNSATNTIVVSALPVVTFPGILVSQCASSTIYTLSGGSPAGGTYSGPGVTGTNFNASLAGAGTHTITYTYTSVAGCTNSATNTIVVKALPVVTFPGILTSQCVSSTVYVLSGGTPAGGTYSGPGVTGTNFNASIAGAGTHTIVYSYTDVISGCSNTATNTIVVKALPAVTFPGVLTAQCVSSTVYTLSGGTPAGGTYTGTGVTGTNFNASVAGTGTHTITYTYTDIVTGCTNKATNTIVVNPLPAPTFTAQPGATACTNSDVTYTTQPGQSNYEWIFPGVLNVDYKLTSGGTSTDNTVTLKWLTAGSKTVTINYTSGVGCKAAAATPSTPTVVTESPSVSDAGPDQTAPLMCGITSTKLAANTPLAGTGTWSIISGTGGTIAAPDNPESIFSGTAGMQYVLRWTISNSICTPSTDDVIIRFFQSPTVTETHTDVLCFGKSNGTINITATGGTAPYTYLWTGSGVAPLSEDQNGLSAGLYSVIVTDANGCVSASLPVTISEPSALSGNISSKTNVSVFGGNDGSVTLAGTGGTAPYQYKSGSGAYQSSGTFGSLLAGSYTFTIRDMNLCTFIIEVIITQPVQPLSGSIVSKTDVVCYGASTGSVTVVASGGVAPYEYKLGAGSYQSSGTFGPLAAGTYIITVRDAVPSAFDVTVTISQPAEALTGAISSRTNVMCFGGNNGTVTVTGSGGTSPYKYKLGAGSFQDSGTFGTLAAGTYTINIQDANLCIFNLAVTITQPQAGLSGSVASQTNVLCFGSANGSVTALGAGGTSPYMYSLNGGTYQSSGTFNGLTAATHTITVRDANLCITSIQVTLTQPSALSVSHTSEESSCRGVRDGKITLSVSGGSPPYNAIWSDGIATVDRTNISDGSYSVVVTDKNGCAATLNVEVGFNISDQCIEIPDIITPNYDGFNDTWQIKNIDLFSNAEVFVYNRWGMLVFNTKNISANAWDGTFKGKLLPTDSYHYVLHLNDGSEPRTGVVSIIR